MPAEVDEFCDEITEVTASFPGGIRQCEEPEAMSGRRTRRARRVPRPAPQPVITLREHAEPMMTALRIAKGDRSRLRVISKTEVPYRQRRPAVIPNEAIAEIDLGTSQWDHQCMSSGPSEEPTSGRHAGDGRRRRKRLREVWEYRGRHEVKPARRLVWLRLVIGVLLLGLALIIWIGQDETEGVVEWPGVVSYSVGGHTYVLEDAETGDSTIGEQLTVEYNPDAPSAARVKPDTLLGQAPLLLLSLSVLFLLSAAGVFEDASDSAGWA